MSSQEIPLANIRPNPDNPGPPASEEEIDELAANIAEVGLKNPAKVRPEPTGPLAPGVTLHPDNPRLKGDGTPWKVEDFIYRLISGHSRRRAFQKLQRTTLPSQVLNPTEEGAVILGRADNQVRSDRGWWADYQEVENLIKAATLQTQGGIAAKLKMNEGKVNRAIGLLPLLNPAARALITSRGGNSNPGNKGISDRAAYQLAALGPGTGLKPGVRKKRAAGEAGSPMDPAHPSHGPQLEASAQGDAQRLWPYPPIPAETQGLVYRTLKEAWGQGLTEAGVKGLVDWVKGGHNPEDFDTSMAPLKKASALRPQATMDEAASRGQSLGSAGSKTEPAEGQDLSVPIPGEQGIGKGNEPGDYDPAKAKAVEPPRAPSSPSTAKAKAQPEIATSAHANAPMALAQPNRVAQPEASQQVNAPMGAVPRNDGSTVTTIPPSSPFVKGGDKAKHKKAAGTTVTPVGNQPSNPSLEAWAQGAGSPKEPAQPKRAPILEAWAQADPAAKFAGDAAGEAIRKLSSF